MKYNAYQVTYHWRVQYLRMLTNSIIGGLLVGAYVTILVLQLNPNVQLNSISVVPLVLTPWTFYGLHAAVFFYALIVLRQLLSVEVRSPGWIRPDRSVTSEKVPSPLFRKSWSGPKAVT